MGVVNCHETVDRCQETPSAGAMDTGYGLACKIMHSGREFVYKILRKQLRINDRTIAAAAYNAAIKVMGPWLALKAEAFQAILDEVAQSDGRAKKVKPQELTDPRFLSDMEKSGFWDQIWGKR